MQLSIQHIDFTYEGSATPIFENWSVSVDTSWRLALIGRNGRGKTTLLQLLAGMPPDAGRISLPLPAVYFPYPVSDPEQQAFAVLQQAAPDAEDWRLQMECSQLQLSEEALKRPFSTLSRGEQTKALLAALFAREDVYPLIDEPTNHLDLHGRMLVADYLRRKDGFLLVSHDRAFLNRCTDHVLAIGKTETWVLQGNYDAYETRLNQQTAYEAASQEKLRREVSRLEESARQAAQWAQKGERGKFHVPASEAAVVDRGYVGARSASMMKKAGNTLHRREKALQEKALLLKNAERVGDIHLSPLLFPKETLLTVRDGSIQYHDRVVANDIQLTISRGDRLALTGANGCGKSSLIRALCGEGNALKGNVHISSGLVVSYVSQETDHLFGTMRDFLRTNQLDETLFKAILRNMDFTRDLFERPLEQLSQGQKKKILLARSLCTPAHLYLWDEPLNYLDVFSRVQLERLIRDAGPTLLLVEHDATFLQTVCNRESIEIQKAIQN